MSNRQLCRTDRRNSQQCTCFCRGAEIIACTPGSLTECSRRDEKVRTGLRFGAPRVGSARVAFAYDEAAEASAGQGFSNDTISARAKVPKAWRIFSTSDVVPAVPPTSLWGAPLHFVARVTLQPFAEQLWFGRLPPCWYRGAIGSSKE